MVFLLHIAYLAGKPVATTINEELVVNDILAEAMGGSRCAYITHNGVKLADDAKLQEVVPEGATVRFVGRIRGGMPRYRSPSQPRRQGAPDGQGDGATPMDQDGAAGPDGANPWGGFRPRSDLPRAREGEPGLYGGLQKRLFIPSEYERFLNTDDNGATIALVNGRLVEQGYCRPFHECRGEMPDGSRCANWLYCHRALGAEPAAQCKNCGERWPTEEFQHIMS